MSAVVRLAINNSWPLMLGDILISGVERPGESARLPTIEKITDIFPEGSGLVPTGLRQKIAILSDNLVIGWAGDYIAAKTVITDLYEKTKKNPFTKASLSDYFSSIDKMVWDRGVGFVGFVKEPLGLSSFGYNYESIRTSHFGEIGFLGSGSEGLQAHLSQFSELPSALEGAPNVLLSSLSFALIISGALLETELATLESLRNFYGGGYEIASLFEGKFQKLDDVAYVFWIARVDDHNVHIAQVPRHAFSYAYTNDVLKIRSLSFDETKTGASVRQSEHVVPPIYRHVTDRELASLNVPALNNKWLCNCFFVTPKSGRREILVTVDFRATGERHVRFIDEANQIIVAVENEFIELAGENIFRHYNT